jgi:phosphodiesterase/alkaline phosphatase D-like protein
MNGHTGAANQNLVVTDLANNTLYTYSGTVTNDYGRTATDSKTLYNVPVKPLCSASVDSVGRDSATISVSGSYDTNRTLGSIEVQYGTSTAYGSVSYNGVLTGLQPNVNYNWRARVIDANNGGPYTQALSSDWVTGTFRTIGNAPVINSVSSTIDRTSARLVPNVTYDNSALGSARIDYGTTTDYGLVSTGWNITGLSPNTKYYYSIQVTDQEGRTSNAFTGEFTTTGNAPVLSDVTTETAVFSARFTYAVHFDEGAGAAGYVLDYGTTTAYGQTKEGPVQMQFILSGLQPETLYYYRLRIKDSTGRYSNAVTGSITTLADQASLYAKKNGSWLSGKAWVKVNGAWVKAKKVYKKINGSWIVGK